MPVSVAEPAYQAPDEERQDDDPEETAQEQQWQQEPFLYTIYRVVSCNKRIHLAVSSLQRS